jgi:serine phosphatase RsbU (regulator of sigma subunit)
MVRIVSRRLRESDNALIRNLHEKNQQLTQAFHDLQVAQVQLIEHERLEHARQVAHERLEQELRLAQLVQQTLLRKPLPDLPGWMVTTYYQPARAVGGDFYDVLTLPTGHLGLVVGDVSGKGIPAALLMATTCSILRGVAHGLDSPAAVLAQANDLLCPDMPASMFVTCLYALLDPASGQMQYANAGHDLPYRQHSGGVDELRATGLPLGLWLGNRYEDKEAMLLPGERILFSSDGLVEARNPQREMFGSARLRALLANHAAASGAALVDGLLAALAQFTGAGWEQEDDIMLVTLARSVTGAGQGSPAEGERHA